MSSGLCFDNGLISRGSCTDPTWKDPACAQYCVDAIPTGDSPIIPSQWTDVLVVSEIGWCCDFPIANGSCAQGREVKIAAGTVLPNSTAAASTSSATGTSSGTASSTATSTAACNAAGQSSSVNSTCPANHDAAIGAGIGAPLGIAVVSLLLLWLREKRMRKKAAAGVLAPASELGAMRDGRGAPSELGGGPRYGELP
ncbi:uncharacterized protein PAC_04450 [Phialocephala subalpina]|uniref:Uncharacterized protein n=1 Tax=Phialocephala subalpina TaxID=576137 RepID=A0A1L7WP74_9HELO|nr:uncharacterized protein PAC_04450 [Phialocephala subalpina]